MTSRNSSTNSSPVQSWKSLCLKIPLQVLRLLWGPTVTGMSKNGMTFSRLRSCSSLRSSTMRSSQRCLVTPWGSAPRILTSSHCILKGDFAATFRSSWELITIILRYGDQPIKGAPTPPRQDFFTLLGIGKGPFRLIESIWKRFVVQLRGSPPTRESQLGEHVRGSPALNVLGLPRSYTPNRSCKASIGIDPRPARQTRRDQRVEQCGPHYPPVSGEEKGQRGVLVGDSPQTGPPQPTESISPPLRVAPYGKTRRPLVGKEAGRTKKEERNRTTGSSKGSGTEDAARWKYLSLAASYCLARDRQAVDIILYTPQENGPVPTRATHGRVCWATSTETLGEESPEEAGRFWPILTSGSSVSPSGVAKSDSASDCNWKSAGDSRRSHLLSRSLQPVGLDLLVDLKKIWGKFHKLFSNKTYRNLWSGYFQNFFFKGSRKQKVYFSAFYGSIYQTFAVYITE